jgi:hypothetical protein
MYKKQMLQKNYFGSNLFTKNHLPPSGIELSTRGRNVGRFNQLSYMILPPGRNKVKINQMMVFDEINLDWVLILSLLVSRTKH